MVGHGIHIRSGTLQPQRSLLLRDYLQDHPQAGEEYAAIKREAAETYTNDITAYSTEV